jgi:hypothetical protein
LLPGRGARGKRDQIDKAKAKSQSQKKKPISKTKDSKKEKPKRQAKNQEEAIKKQERKASKTTTQQPDTLRTGCQCPFRKRGGRSVRPPA